MLVYLVTNKTNGKKYVGQHAGMEWTVSNSAGVACDYMAVTVANK
jgi:hypothetical protein